MHLFWTKRNMRAWARKLANIKFQTDIQKNNTLLIALLTYTHIMRVISALYLIEVWYHFIFPLMHWFTATYLNSTSIICIVKLLCSEKQTYFVFIFRCSTDWILKWEFEYWECFWESITFKRTLAPFLLKIPVCTYRWLLMITFSL